MLFPANPDKIPTLWDSMAEQLAQNPTVALVGYGEELPEQVGILMSSGQILAAIDELKRSKIKRIGASHGRAVGPYWSFDADGRRATVQTYISHVNAGEKLTVKRKSDEISSIVINLEFECKEIEEVYFPMKGVELKVDGWRASEQPNGMLLVRER